MKHESQNIQNLLGFGNDRVGEEGEHYQSVNLEVGRAGMSMNQALREPTQKETYYDNTEVFIENIVDMASGNGFEMRSNGGISPNNPFVYALTGAGKVWYSENGTEPWRLRADLDDTFNNFIGSEGADRARAKSVSTDPSGRLMVTANDELYAENNAGDQARKIDVTNGSNKIQDNDIGFNKNNGGATGDDPAYFVGKNVTITDGDKDYIYKVTAQTDTELTISAAYQGTTQTNIPALFGVGWEENVGGGITTGTQHDFDHVSPVANYEDTVLIGSANKISTYNIVSDSVADEALTFPEGAGFKIRNILIGSTGILIVANFNEQGVLALWDNSAARSIAPWIYLDEKITGATVIDGSFMIRTIRSLYLTDGYSARLMKTDFLDQDQYPEKTEWRNNMATTNDGFYIALDSDGYRGKAASGIYHYRSSTELFTHLRADDGDSKNIDVQVIQADPQSGRVFFAVNNGEDQKLMYLERGGIPKYASYTSQELVGGANNKYASAVYIDLGVADPTYEDNPISFTIVAKVADVDRQMQKATAVKTTQTVANKIVVDETVYPQARIGDELVILEGNNASQTRSIEEIADGGTDTTTYTLDRDLDAMSAADDEMIITPFRQIGIQTYTDEDEIPQIFFNVGNDVKGRRFMVKIEIIDSEIPLELRPSYFIYENDTIV